VSLWVDLLGAETRFAGRRYRTRVCTAGPADAPALVLLHGTGGHLENWARNIMPLAANFHVIAPDFLWHGLSQTEPFDPEIIPSLVDQVIDLMDDLKASKAAVNGQSMGGWVAMQLALRHPERVSSLILTTTQGYVPDNGAIPGYAEPDWSQNLPSTLEALRDPSFENIRIRMARILADPARLTDEAIAIRQVLYSNPALAAVQAEFNREYLGMGQASRQHAMTDAMARQIACPVLVYWGDKNRTPPALGEHIARTVPNGRFHCAADTGHWAQFESADEHNRVVSEFLLAGAATGKIAA
jgi:2-hydroxy-6-oxonona-2,4-dienedioate hydrolase